MDDLFGWYNHDLAAERIVRPWKPQPLSHGEWPPDYKAVYAWRIETLEHLNQDAELLQAAKLYYRDRPWEFIPHWMDTYNPRKQDTKWMPFVFFEKQQVFIKYLHELRKNGESGLVEKCRDVGATWLSCGYSVHSFLFINNDAIGWGSRKQDLVDKLGNPDSIFEKMRLILRRLPQIWLPHGFSERDHASHMKLLNPENGSVIMGEAGDNIGRGGRTSMYFKDESAHYERPEKVEAALGDNTETQVDISSVNGLGNVFHRRREAGDNYVPTAPMRAGAVQVFVIDWRDHPEKTQEWYDTRKAKFEREGMAHIFAQEVDRDYSAAISNTIIKPEWIEAAVDAHLQIRWRTEDGKIRIGFKENEIPDTWSAGLDVADEGIDKNALCKRQWIVWRDVEEWVDRDVGVTTRRAVASLRSHKGIKLEYDCVGIGAGVKSEYNRLLEDKHLKASDLIMVPWNAGAGVQDPYFRIVPDDEESPLNRDVFANLKAQAWQSAANRFYKTYKNITEGILYPVEELISLDSNMALLAQLKKELAQATRGDSTALRMVVEKQPNGTKSPNLADAGIMAYFPINKGMNHVQQGQRGGG